MNHQIHWLAFGGLQVYVQQCMKQFELTQTLNTCEHCVQLDANYVTSDHWHVSNPEEFLAVVMRRQLLELFIGQRNSSCSSLE